MRILLSAFDHVSFTPENFGSADPNSYGPSVLHHTG